MQRFFSAASQNRDRIKRRVLLRPRLCSAPLREELRAALRPGHGETHYTSRRDIQLMIGIAGSTQPMPATT
jgi:hypothetical protein